MAKKTERFEDLEKADFEIVKAPLRHPSKSCSCGSKMKAGEMDISLQNGISVKVQGLSCSKCGKHLMTLKESEKLDHALVLTRLLGNGFKLERKLSFDGDNYIFRVPKEFAGDITEKKVEITPMGTREFCAVVK